MLRTKLLRHTLAFSLILGASIALYPAAQAKNDLLVWGLLALIGIAATLTIFEKS